MIDTLELVRRMREVGIEQRQAEVLAQLFRETALAMRSQLVTRQILRSELELAEGWLTLHLGTILIGMLALQLLVLLAL